jgi:hypothetical protein
MICPRCGVLNTPEREYCSRCSGSLAPPPSRDDRPLPPVLPITKRAELKLGRTSTPAPAGPASTGSAAPYAVGAAPVPAVETGGGDLYLLESERSTGQPAPPDGSLAPGDPVRANRRGTITVGLSRA